MPRGFDPSLVTALLLIDNQRGVDREDPFWGDSTSNPEYESNVVALLTAFRSARNKALIFHVGHSSLDPKSPLHPDHPRGGIAFSHNLEPASGEPVFWKNTHSAFINTDLESALRDKNVKQLVVAGVTTDNSVSSTIRTAENLKIVGTSGRIILADDATFAFGKHGYDGETVHGVSVATLRDEFAEIWKTVDIIKEMKQL